MATDYRAVNWNDAADPLDLAAMTAFTVELSINPDNWSDQDGIWTIGNGFGRIALTAPVLVGANSSISELYVIYATPSANTAVIPLSTSLVAGTWYDVAVVYRDDAVSNPLNDNLQIWLDGVLVGSASTRSCGSPKYALQRFTKPCAACW